MVSFVDVQNFAAVLDFVQGQWAVARDSLMESGEWDPSDGPLAQPVSITEVVGACEDMPIGGDLRRNALAVIAEYSDSTQRGVFVTQDYPALDPKNPIKDRAVETIFDEDLNPDTFRGSVLLELQPMED